VPKGREKKIQYIEHGTPAYSIFENINMNKGVSMTEEGNLKQGGIFEADIDLNNFDSITQKK